MISYQVYKMVHFLGIFMLMLALGGFIFQTISGSGKLFTGRKVALIMHGSGLFLVLLGGFGMLARLGLTAGLPGWIYGKLVIWLLLGAVILTARLKPRLGYLMGGVSVLLAFAAAYFAIAKPL